MSAAEIQTDLNTPVASTNPAAPVADFAASTRSGTAPLTTTFSDLSTGEVTGWSWDFGDGTRVATQSPQHTYTAPGTYSVTLTVTGPRGTHSATKTDYVQVLPPAPVADFAASVGSGLAPLTTTFSCKSSGDITARRWDFGDGGTSTAATAVHTYTVPGTYAVSLWVSGPGGEDTEVKSAFITENAPAPVADFTGDVQQGSAPLTVRFHNASTGQFTASAWNFGEGSTSDQSHPTPTYTEPGLYAVTLTVSGGPGGSNTRTRSDYVQVDAAEVPMEVGELLVNDQWQRVDFQTPFTDPIMVASPLSNNDGVPAVVRIYGVDPEGFWIRVQEWGYLDGKHANEAVSYTAIERGRHQLPDGAWVEAGRLAKGTIAFAATTFSEPFAEVPVVFSTVTSVNEADAVVTRMRQISVTGFQVRMWEQEVNKQKHLPESIDYIAWEPSFGVVNGLRYEVGRMGALVSHSVSTLVYQAAFAQPPIFLADMQTTNGGDTANLRWLNRTEVALEVWVSEEQSRDAETAHVAESVGYFAADEAQ